MFKVPAFSNENYSDVINKPYTKQDTNTWLDFSQIISFLSPSTIKKRATTDARTIAKKTSDTSIIQAKLVCPTLRCSDYFFRNTGEGTHHGVDIMLPQYTPMYSFCAGTVTKVKKRDGVSKNEGNCVTIKSGSCYRSYEHCESILVRIGDKIEEGQQIATCGSTGNSTQFHLHLQCDTLDSPFQPYYDANGNIATIQRYTLDPIEQIKKIGTSTKPTTNEIFIDMPNEKKYQEAITILFNKGIIKGANGKFFPKQALKRYEFALLIHRTMTTYNLAKNLLPLNPEGVQYTDVEAYPKEVQNALTELYLYGIMQGYKGLFSPEKNLTGEEVLAVLGRLFYGIQNASQGNWRDTYYKLFMQKKYIDTSRQFIGTALPRQETARLLYCCITKTT